MGEGENWTLRICPAFVQTINETDTGLLCSQQSLLNKQAVRLLIFFTLLISFSEKNGTVQIRENSQRQVRLLQTVMPSRQ